MVLRFSRGRVGSRLFKVRSKGLTFFCALISAGTVRLLRKVEASVLKSSIDIPSPLSPPFVRRGFFVLGGRAELLRICTVLTSHSKAAFFKRDFAILQPIMLTMKKIEAIKAAVIALEKQALERWNDGDPDGFIELSADDVVYMDPAFEHKLEGKKALETYYDQVRGKIKIDRYEMLDPVVQVSPGIAVLTYNYEAYRDGCVFRMNCTEVYRLDSSGPWRIIHTHWSFFQPHK